MPNDLQETYQSPRWTGEIADCSLPVTFDTYSKCSFGCLYCFSAFQKTLHRGRAEENTYEQPLHCVNVDRVKRIFLGEVKSQFWPWISQKRPIQWGGLSDQFDLWEKKYGKTLELMEFFDSIDYPISFSTKTAFYNAESNLAHAHNNLCDIVRLGDIADFFEDVVHRSDLL